MTGTIFDIMRYSIHDGPGIRTTVFLKGCPLSCWWCHNPESQSAKKEILFNRDRCIGCGECKTVCPAGDGKCLACGNCAGVCCSGARELVGKTVEPAEIIKEIEKDLIFYEESGGGVTFSGGEPLLQADFVQCLLELCRKREIHTAIETSGFAPLEKLLQLSAGTDLFLYDLKLMDDLKHQKYTGVSNRLIIQNLRALAAQHDNIIVRVPVIPGINDDDGNINKTGDFVSALGIREINILPYHKAGMDKYERIGRTYLLPGLEPPTGERVAELAGILQGKGLKVKIGG